MKKLKSYFVEYLPPRCSKKLMHSKIVYGMSREEVDVVIHNVYPQILNAQHYTIGTGFARSKILASEGKVSYLDDVVKRETF